MTSITWLITGCSSGFGEIFVHRLLARGDHVIATGRNASERLGHLKAIGARILDLDITEPQEILNIKMEEAIGFFGGIDVLVNNAGYIELGLAEEVRYVNFWRHSCLTTGPPVNVKCVDVFKEAWEI